MLKYLLGHHQALRYRFGMEGRSTKMETTGSRTLKINQPDFRRYAIEQVPATDPRYSHGGFAYIAECYELVDGHWEGFIAIHTFEDFAADNLSLEGWDAHLDKQTAAALKGGRR
jgi:hypothetical protein